ncbi:DEAD/DEAH box helicase family protein [Corallococcus sp. M7]
MVVAPVLTRRDYGFLKDVSMATHAPPLEVADPLRHLLASALLSKHFRLKFARPVEPLGPGLYHEKVGLFFDHSGDFVAFSGSLNDTYAAQYKNFERIHVFCSWKAEDQQQALELHAHLEALWEGDVAGLEVRDYASSLEWCTTFLDNPPPPETNDVEEAMSRGGDEFPTDNRSRQPSVPENLKLHRHQTAAIAAWTSAQFRGVLEMATGSGKTITALTASVLLARRLKQLLVVVVCPYTHLVDQWVREAQAFGFHPIKCYGSRRSWQGSLARAIGLLSSGTQTVVLAITTMATFSEDSFLTAIAPAGTRMLIGDEVHGMGASSQLSALQRAGEFRYRLGLSATPERWFDPHGTEAILEFFGTVVFRYTLGDALSEGSLVPYDYFPELVELTPSEAQRYQEITRKLGPFISKTGQLGESSDAALTALLTRRARLLASASNKHRRLQELLGESLASGAPVSRTLIYCGDGTVETDRDDPNPDEQRQVEVVADLLAQRLHITCGIYVAETKLEERLRLQTQLVTGRIQAIVAIRCLDEGVDIPPVRTAYILASSRNPRQFIQRRGRLLRRDDTSQKTHATIYDFVVVPPNGGTDMAWKTERDLLRGELKRIVEFSSLARNEGVSLKRLRPLREQYNLIGFSGDT